MGHVPHVYVPAPWNGAALDLAPDTLRHLRNVLRRRTGSPVSYSDGRGVIGAGVFTGETIERGEEDRRSARSGIRVVVAPPHRTERVRLMVEKLVELGIDSLSWLTSEHRQGREPRPDKCEAWAIGALEQSRGSWLPVIEGGISLSSLGSEPGAWIADPTAPGRLPADVTAPLTLVVGPEGGFARNEVPAQMKRFTLGSSILHTETAAIAAVVIASDRLA